MADYQLSHSKCSVVNLIVSWNIHKNLASNIVTHSTYGNKNALGKTSMKKRPKFVLWQRTSTFKVRQCLVTQLMSRTDVVKTTKKEVGLHFVQYYSHAIMHEIIFNTVSLTWLKSKQVGSLRRLVLAGLIVVSRSLSGPTTLKLPWGYWEVTILAKRVQTGATVQSTDKERNYWSETGQQMFALDSLSFKWKNPAYLNRFWSWSIKTDIEEVFPSL